MWHDRVMTDTEKDDARTRLKRASAAFTRGEDQQKHRREALAEAIADAFRAGLRPSEIEDIAPYDRNHIGRIRKAAGIPARRARTVVSAKEARDRPADE
jgi:septal ring factor EnvC (AmiA/AmiB activator)